MSTCACGEEIVAPDPATLFTVPAGWCAPTELMYTPPVVEMCTDCKVRMLMIMELGIDPGKNGENLRVKRGGIKYR